jgi:hypothetical protein
MGKRVCIVCVCISALFSATHREATIAGEPKVLNNFVTQLVQKEHVTGPATTIEFSLPKAGWVFISSTAATKDEGNIVVALDANNQTVLTHASDKQPEQEAMRHLDEGKHRVVVRCRGAAALESLSVRTIPDLLFYSCLYGHPGLIEYSPYDEELIESLIRKGTNHLVVHAGQKMSGDAIQEWTDQGRRWIGGCGIAWGDEQQNYDYWTKHLRDNPHLDGLIADEFCPRARIANGKPRFFPAQYRDCSTALTRIRATDAFEQKQFVAYIGDWHRYIWEESPETSGFIRGLMDDDYRYSWERYCREQPNEAVAERYLCLESEPAPRSVAGRTAGRRAKLDHVLVPDNAAGSQPQYPPPRRL